MKSFFLSRLSVLPLVAALASWAQGTPAPSASPDPSAPFVDSVLVHLFVDGGSGGLEIYYDIHDSEPDLPFNPLTAKLYEDDRIPVRDNAVIRAQAMNRGGAPSKVSEFRYVRDLPPTVSLATPAAGAVLRQGGSYFLTASVSDPEGHAIGSVLYEMAHRDSAVWRGLGATSTGPNYAVAFDWSGKALGPYRIRARANDAYGASAWSAERPVTLAEDLRPDVRVTQPSANSVIPTGQTITLAATAVDQDGEGISRVDFYRGAVLIGTGAPSATEANTWTLAWTSAPAGAHEIQAKAYDGRSPPLFGSSSAVPITVRSPNKKPVVSLVVTPSGTREPASATLSATASDSDGTITSVAFYRGSERLFQDTQAPFVHAVSGLGAGTHVFTARAYDNAVPPDSAVSASQSLTISQNRPPAADAGRDTSVVYPATLVLNGSRTADPDGDSLSLAWIEPSGATLSGAGGAAPTASFSTHGDFTFLLVATERGSTGLKDTDEVKVSVYRAPAITSRLSDTATAGTPYAYSVLATGHNPPTVSTGASLPAWLTFSPPSANDGTYGRLSGTPVGGGTQPIAVTLTATNNVGSDTRTLNIYVRDRARITAQHPETLAVVMEGTRYAMSVAAAGTPAPTYQWQMLSASGPVGVGTNSPTFALDPASLTSSGVYRVIVRNGVGAPDTGRSVRVDVRAAIRITSFGPSPGQTAVAGRRASFWVKATGSPPLAYQWFRGTAALAGATRDTLHLDPAKAADAGLYRVRVTNPLSDTTRPGTFALSDTTRLTVEAPRVDRPKAEPAAPRDYRDEGLTVRLRTDTPGTVIRYTLNDASGPTASTGLAYDSSTGIRLSGQTAVLRARAYRAGYLESELLSGTYTYVPKSEVAAPTARPALATFRTSILCTLETSTPGASIRYTLDGTDPRTSATALAYSGPFRLSATTTVTAFAQASGLTASPTMTRVYTLETPQSRVQAPEATPPGGAFLDRVQVSLASLTDGAAIHYTLDGTSPDTSRTRVAYAGAFTLSRTTVVKAIATRTGYLPSDIAAWSFPLSPGPVAASPDGGVVFKDSLRVTLSAAAGAAVWYTLSDALPLDSSGVPGPDAVRYDGGGILLTDSRTVTAMALKDQVPGPAARFSYIRQGGALTTPIVLTEGNAYTFTRSLRVRLSATPGAIVRYTLDGRVPTSASPVYDSALVLDTTATLQAVATQTGFLPSKILVATFTLVADTPRADPPAGSYPTAQAVRLTAASPRTSIRYTLDGTTPGPDHGEAYRSTPILIDRNTVLKAVAVAGGVAGPVLTAAYDIFVARDTVIRPSETWFMPGGYSLANPGDQGSAVRVRIDSAQALPIRDFRDVQYGLILSAAVPGQEFPSLTLSRPAQERRALYKVEPGGQVYFLSEAEWVVIAEPGTYFFGTDAAPPEITWLGETVGQDDSTAVRFRVKDNVHNLAWFARRSDRPGAASLPEPVPSGGELTFRLRHPSGTLKPLTLQLGVGDYRAWASYPPDGVSGLALSQGLRDIAGPEVWRIGRHPDSLHDLVGIPLDLDPGLTVDALGDDRSGPVDAFVYDDGTEKYRRLGRRDTLKPGTAYWIAALKPLPSFRRASAKTRPRGDARYEVSLRRGWNQIANPHLETLHWPYPRHLGDAYRASPIKGLWQYQPEDPRRYVERDSLEPWRGYYVFSYVPRETTIVLSARAIPRATAKVAEAARDARLSLGFGDAPAVLLGASPRSGDGLGFEDEGALPLLSARHRLKAVRGGRGLSADWVRLAGEGILRWRVLAVPGAGGGALPALRVLEESLPGGFEAWALSRVRGMKFRLDPAGALPVSGLPGDTLEVVAGPAAALARLDLWNALSVEAPGLDVRIRGRAEGPAMELDLPGAAQVRAVLWTLDGRRLGELRRDLPAGRYRFAYSGDFRADVAGMASGVHFLRVEVKGPGLSRALVRKAVLPR